MKHVYFLCLSILLWNTGYSNRIIINTLECCKLYNFFPLRTNFLQFSVRANNDIHILLVNGPQFSAPYYEIVIGGWFNTQSVIRKDNQDHQLEYKATVLKPGRFQPFVVNIDEEEGKIEVGKRKGSYFMTFTDPDFVKMSYFGISTGFQSAGEWNFEFDNFYCACIRCNHSTSASGGGGAYPQLRQVP